MITLMTRYDLHVKPSRIDIANNMRVEPEGERIRAELEDFLERNKISGISLDTHLHCVDIQIARLPPRIKPVLRKWGSIYVIDTES